MNQELEIKNQSYGETEQKTPKAGYILLIIMFVVSLYFGWRALDDLGNVPRKPELLSRCAASFITYTWEDYGRYPSPEYIYAPAVEPYEFSYPPKQEKPECVFSSFEVAYGVPVIFEKRKSQDLALFNAELDLQKVNRTIDDLERQYNLGLQERIAEEQRKLYPVLEIQNQLAGLRGERTDLENRISAIRAELKPLDDELKTVYLDVMRDYRSAWRWYEFKVFLLELLFVLPIFWFVFQVYRKLLLRHSPYTIIWTALLGVVAVLFARILLVWFWDLFLARVLEEIWDYIRNIALLRSLVFYGGMFLSIAVFGGATYFLQKHIFDPKRVAMRRLREKKCPRCQASLDLAQTFCPNCGMRIREACSSCGKLRFAGMRFCEHCGKEIIV